MHRIRDGSNASSVRCLANGTVEITAPSGIVDESGNPVVSDLISIDVPGKQTIWLPAGAMTSRTTAGAQATSREINSITVPVLAFDQTTDEGANFSIAMPKSWDEGTLTFQAFWTATGGAGVETLQFELRGGCFANSAAINVTGLGTAVPVDDVWLADDDVHVSPESAAVTLSNAAADTVAFFEIIRDVSDDTLTADAELIGIKLFYTTDAVNDA